MEKIRSVISSISFEPESPGSFAGVKTSIQKVDGQIKQVQNKKTEVDQFISESKKIEARCDTINRHKISEASLALQQEWKTLLASLKEHKENLATLALQWEDFEQKYKSFEAQLAVYHQQYSNIETSFSSVRQMAEARKVLTNLEEDVKNMEGRYKDVQILSDNVIK